MQNKSDNLIDVVIITILAGCGGAISYLYYYLQNDRFYIKHFIAQICVSAFCGGMVGYTVGKVYPDFSYAIAGASGVFGIQIFYVLLNIGVRIVGKQASIDTADLKLEPNTLNKTNTIKEKRNNVRNRK